MPCRFKISIAMVEQSLRAVQKDFHHINDTLDMRREAMQDSIVENMLAGYRYVNRMIEKEIDPLRRTYLDHFLELNHIVLCGQEQQARGEYAGHLQATKKRFYEQEGFSIGHLLAWKNKHKNDSPWKRAAGVYIMLLSRPQLFEEGNHRTGALLMSYLLVNSGEPPFLLTVKNAKAYFDPSSLAKETNKDFLGKYYKLPKIKKKFAKFLKKEANHEILTEC
ncbi:MAG: Fic family protein [Desulfosarcina sp.]